MALFPHLEIEYKVQEKDKTRLDASGSYRSKDNSDIANVEVKPNQSLSYISVFDTRKENWFLDYEHDFGIDIVASENDTALIEYNKSSYTLNLTPGSYTLSSFLTELENAFNTALVGLTTVNIVLEEDYFVKIENSGGSIRLLEQETPLWNELGFFRKYEQDLLFTSQIRGEAITFLPRYASVRLTDSDDPTPNTSERFFKFLVATEESDALLSNDSELYVEEPDLDQWIEEGRNTYKKYHREAQEQIIKWLYRNGYVNLYLDKFKVNDLYDKDELNLWSKYLTLYLIMNSQHNATNDVFKEKASMYRKIANKHRRTAVIRIDVDNNKADYIGEQIITNTIRFINI